MWLRLLYLTADEVDDPDQGETVILYSWERGRGAPLTVGCPLASAPRIAGLLRQACARTGVVAPRCDACGTPLDLPSLE